MNSIPLSYGLTDLSRIIRIMSLQKKLKKIKLVITDVDGVLTEGKILLTSDDEIKIFCCRDAPRSKFYLDAGGKIVYYTGRVSKPVERRALEQKIPVFDKHSIGNIYGLIKETFAILPEEILYIGDDLNDIKEMKKAGIAIAPKDASVENKKVAHIVTKVNGGKGVLAEAIEIIMRAQETWKNI